MVKKQLHIIIQIAILAIMLQGCAHSQYPELIVGKWVMSEFEAADSPKGVQENYEYLTGQVYYNFTQEGKFRLSMKGVDQDTGTYTLNGASISLKGSSKGAKYPKYQIESLDKSQLILSSEDKEGHNIKLTYQRR